MEVLKSLPIIATETKQIMKYQVNTPDYLRYDDPRFSPDSSDYDELHAATELLELEYLHGEILSSAGVDFEIVSYDHEHETRAYLYNDGVRVYANGFSTSGDWSFTYVAVSAGSPVDDIANMLNRLAEPDPIEFKISRKYYEFTKTDNTVFTHPKSGLNIPIKTEYLVIYYIENGAPRIVFIKINGVPFSDYFLNETALDLVGAFVEEDMNKKDLK